MSDHYLGQSRVGLDYTRRYARRMLTDEEIARWLPPIETRLAYMGVLVMSRNVDIQCALAPWASTIAERFAKKLIHGPWDRIVRRRARQQALQQLARDYTTLATEYAVEQFLGYTYPLCEADRAQLDFLERRRRELDARWEWLETY